MTSLYVRLSSVFLIILLLFGAFSLWIAEHSTRAYFLESTQQLNAPIAEYMSANLSLVTDGLVDTESLAQLADVIMIINPGIELYLLDTDGKVMAQAANANRIAQITVDLDPIKRFLSAVEDGETRTRTVLGDNPLNVSEQRVFSASRLMDKEELVGYVYVVLAGQQHQSVLNSIGSSYSVRNLALMLAVLLLMAGFAGVVVFFTLTRRLRCLTRRVQRWQTRGFGSLALASEHKEQQAAEHDEIDELARAYDAMTLKLQDQYLELESKDKSRRELMANISHDLRTPLTTMQGYLETVLLKHGQLDKHIEKRYLDIAHKHGMRLSVLVAQLFELSKFDSGDVSLNPERFSLLELAHDAMQDIELRAQKRCVNLSVNVQGANSADYEVMADISMIHRVFENLLDNALRFTPDNGSIRIELEVMPEQEIRITVADTGCGMTQSDAQRVFEPGFSLAKGIEDSDKHAGLGLAIVNSIVSLHESTIHVACEVNKGSCFTFELPSAPVLSENQTLLSAIV
ncbi:MAG: sensor histidine kinase [Granulosicoccus sp.]